MNCLELDEKIVNLRKIMGEMATQICMQNPKYRELKGRLDTYLELQAEMVSQPQKIDME